ncbi:aminopeptidase P family protein [Leeuwenhoekiella polynyae]|uniref:Xaa-Pro aminopeptidase n=1 Tax=Leeuwenhoekiella polynyae TaxID=1550906 RepID=A0A4V1KPS4_9FLAO|nr:aminopeptidase P family protein [Leeuwenhoekiella polynyae]RXG17105.1 Xaa-Pro aminopeptidase [Leeuwenhoekiella polynyae]
MFPKNTYVNRRNILKQTLKSGIVLLPGNGESSMNYADNWYPFKQDSSFLYYTGIDHIPDLYFLINIDTGEEILFGNNATPEEKVWIGAPEKLESFAEKSGFSTVKPLDQVASYLKTQLDKGLHVHYLPPYRGAQKIAISNLLNIPLAEVEANKSTALIQAIVAQRERKSAEELVELNEAVNITRKMHEYAIRNTKPGMTEMEVAGALNGIAVSGGGGLAFPIILTKNGQYLHNHATTATLNEGDLVLCDSGAYNKMGYGGDMTRTFPAGKTFTPLQKDVYNIVLNAHNTAIEVLKPGIRFKEVHLLASKKLVEGLTDLGLMKGNADNAVAAGAHTLFFQCGLGHMMGLDIHDMENMGEQYVGYTPELEKSTEFGLKSLRLGKELQEDFVLTVEPGLYFNPFLIDERRAQNKYMDFVNYDEVEKFKNFGGIRVEEDFVITKEGSDLLGEPLAKTVADIEKLRNN